jgi:hypothetical protein
MANTTLDCYHAGSTLANSNWSSLAVSDMTTCYGHTSVTQDDLLAGQVVRDVAVQAVTGLLDAPTTYTRMIQLPPVSILTYGAAMMWLQTSDCNTEDASREHWGFVTSGYFHR